MSHGWHVYLFAFEMEIMIPRTIAKKYPIVYDEDSSELTPEMEKAFLLAAVSRNRFKIVKRKR